MKKLLTLLVVLLVASLFVYVVVVIFQKPEDTKPTFEVKMPTKEEMRIPPQKCQEFLDTNPNACDKG